MTDKQRAIFDKITELKDRLEDFKCEMGLLRDACEKLSQERDTAIQRAEAVIAELSKRNQYIKALEHDVGVLLARAEKAEAEAAEYLSLLREYDDKNTGLEIENHNLRGIQAEAEAELAEQKERARVGRLHAMETKNRLQGALKLYGNPENWRFSHDKDGNLLWITSLGPETAMEALHPDAAQESSEEKEISHV